MHISQFLWTPGIRQERPTTGVWSEGTEGPSQPASIDSYKGLVGAHFSLALFVLG